jgi:hypothetical protein
MGIRHVVIGLAVAGAIVAGCAPSPSDEPSPLAAAPAASDDRPMLRVELAPGLTGVAEAPAPETDQVPLFELEGFDIDAVDATVDADTATLAWIDGAGTLWIAPLADAPAGARAVAHGAIVGLAAARGRLAYAVRIDGPDTAPFVRDLRTDETAPLSDGAGPDEILGFSPDGSEVLLLSGRTGLASLFAASVGRPVARQLTNRGLAPGPALDPDLVTPAPASRREVAWTARGIEYPAGGLKVEVTP